MCLCLCFLAFSLSICATSIDGNTVYTYWYIDNVEELTLFENTIISLSNPHSIHINATIILQEPIPSNTLFDLDIGVHTDEFAEYPVEVQFVEPGSTVVGNVVVDIVDNRIAVNSLQFDYDITKIYLKFTVTYPTWTQVQTVYDFTIDGLTYECEKNQTWSAWCLSSYNTLGLYVEEGKIYHSSGKILKTGDTTVISSDYVDKDKSYYLETLAPAVTYIDFYIGNNKCTAVSGMTFEAWANSEYNTLSLIVDGTSLYTIDKSAILANNGIPVISTNKIIEGNIYTLSPFSVTPVFYFNNIRCEFEEGMTWAQFVNSSYNVIDLYIEDNYVLWADTEFNVVYPNETNVKANELIQADAKYYDLLYLWNNGATYSRYQYEFDFSITSVDVTIQDEGGLLNGIIAWLKKIKDSIVELPKNIAQTVAAKIQGLFVPDQEDLLEIIDKFELLLQERFGIAYDANKIIDDLATSFTYTESKSKILFPQVTVKLAGVDYTFGGWEVNLIPEGFEGLVDTLKFLVNIVCTLAFVMAIRKRWEDILVQ